MQLVGVSSASRVSSACGVVSGAARAQRTQKGETDRWQRQEGRTQLHAASAHEGKRGQSVPCVLSVCLYESGAKRG